LVCLPFVVGFLLSLAHKPEWNVVETSFNASIVDEVLDAYYDENWTGTIELPLEAEVNISNYAWVGADVGETKFEVYFKDVLLSHASAPPMEVKPRSQWTAQSKTVTVITKEVMDLMRSDITEAFTFKTRPRVRGKVYAKVFGLVTVPILIDCSVDVHLADLVSDPSGQVVHDHHCTYKLDL